VKESEISQSTLILSIVLTAGLVAFLTTLMLSAVIISYANEIVSEVENRLTSIEIDCSENFNPGAIKITFGATTNYCFVREVDKGNPAKWTDANSVIVN